MTLSEPAPATTTPPENPQRKSWGWRAGLGLLMVLAAFGVFLALRPAKPVLPAVIVLPAGLPKVLADGFPTERPTLFERYVPRGNSWGWVWKTREVILGRPKLIGIAVAVLHCPEASGMDLPGLPSEKPAYADTSGLQVWFLDDAEVKDASQRIRQMVGTGMVALPRISTASGVQTSLKMNEMQLAALSHVRAEKTDLYFDIIESQYGWFTRGLRCQVPHGKGVFLLHTDAATRGRTAVSIGLSFPPPKK